MAHDTKWWPTRRSRFRRRCPRDIARERRARGRWPCGTCQYRACPSPKPVRRQVVDLSARIRRQSRLMISTLLHLLRLFPFLCGGHRQLALENLALRDRVELEAAVLVVDRHRAVPSLQRPPLVDPIADARHRAEQMVMVAPARDSNPSFSLERAVSRGETYARKYARDHPLPARIHPPPAKDQRKTPRQVRDLPRGFDLPACLTGQCGNQAPPRPRRLHISYFARMGQGAGARWPSWPVSSNDRAGRSGRLP